MRRAGLYIVFLLCAACIAAEDTIPIPLSMTVFELVPQDGPTGSTPDPTDPNQFRASLTGSTLLIETQANAVSYVVVQEQECDSRGEDYFFGISYGSLTCPVTRAGLYTVRIGYWNTDFTGYLCVEKITLTDFNGHWWGADLERLPELPAGFYVMRLHTTAGVTTAKFYKRL